MHGAVAALRWLLGSASRHGVDAESFSSELQQLGLPREHAQAAAKVFGEHIPNITAHLKAKSLRGWYTLAKVPGPRYSQDEAIQSAMSLLKCGQLPDTLVAGICSKIDHVLDYAVLKIYFFKYIFVRVFELSSLHAPIFST